MYFSLDLSALRASYAAGTLTPTALVEEIYRRLEAHADPAIWIHRLSRDELLAYARQVEARGLASQPLYGVPFAIKDNIDLAGVPTTAGWSLLTYRLSRPLSSNVCSMPGRFPLGKPISISSPPAWSEYVLPMACRGIRFILK